MSPEKQSHDQQVCSLDLPIFVKEWTVFEELLLLEGLAIFGQQNWYLLAEFLSHSHSPEQIRNHYFTYYANHKNLQILPKQSEWIIKKNINPIIYAKKKQEYERRNSMESQSQEIDPKMKRIPSFVPESFGFFQKVGQFNINSVPLLQFILKNVRILDNDDEMQKNNKKELIRTYIKKIEHRNLVERQAVKKKLLQSRYSLTSTTNQMTEKIQKKRKVGRPKKYFVEKSDDFEDHQAKAFKLIYSKLAKFDIQKKLYQKLELFQQINATIRNTAKQMKK